MWLQGGGPMQWILQNKMQRVAGITVLAISAALLAWFALVAPVMAKDHAYFITNDQATLLDATTDASLTLSAQALTHAGSHAQDSSLQTSGDLNVV